MTTYRKDFMEGEREVRWTGWRIFWLVLLATIVLSVTGYILGWFGEAAKTAQKEYGPKAMLDKYNWFVNQSNAIKKMDQDVILFRSRVSLIDSTYGPTPKMDPVSKEMYADKKLKAETDLAAVISQRNNLVKDYNSQSEKFTWAPFNSRPDKPAYTFDLVDH